MNVHLESGGEEKRLQFPIERTSVPINQRNATPGGSSSPQGVVKRGEGSTGGLSAKRKLEGGGGRKVHGTGIQKHVG